MSEASALRRSLDALFASLERCSPKAPSAEVLIVEIQPDTQVDERGRMVVCRSDFRSIEEYEVRFDELLLRGLPWLNMNCAGFDGAHVVVSIELPRGAPETSPRTSVNFSGPSRRVLDRDWDVREDLDVR